MPSGNHMFYCIVDIWQLINIPASELRPPCLQAELQQSQWLANKRAWRWSRERFAKETFFLAKMAFSGNMRYVVLSASSHRHSPLPLALAGDARNLATSSLAFRRSFADLSRNLLQNSPANVIDLHHSQHRQEINTASVAAYLPIYKGAGSANM